MIFVKVLVLVREDKSKELRKIVGMVEQFHNLVCVCDGGRIMMIVKRKKWRKSHVCLRDKVATCNLTVAASATESQV